MQNAKQEMQIAKRKAALSGAPILHFAFPVSAFAFSLSYFVAS